MAHLYVNNYLPTLIIAFMLSNLLILDVFKKHLIAIRRVRFRF